MDAACVEVTCPGYQSVVLRDPRVPSEYNSVYMVLPIARTIAGTAQTKSVLQHSQPIDTDIESSVAPVEAPHIIISI